MIPLIEPRQRHGVAIALPVRGLRAATSTWPGSDVTGVTEVVIDVAELIELNLRRSNFLNFSGIELAIFGPLEGQQAMVAVARFGSVQAPDASWWGSLTGGGPLESRKRFAIGGRDWELTARALEPALTHQGSFLILLASLALSLAVAAYVHAAVNRNRDIARQVGERTADLKRATESMRLYFRAIESSANAVLLVDATRPGYPIEYVNPAFERMRGVRAREIVGQLLDDLIAQAPEQASIVELQAAMRACRPGQGSMRLLRKDGSEFFCDVYLAPVHDAAGNTEHFVINEYDVTEARTYQAQLEHLARYDTLTGLPNRMLLGDRIERAAAAAAGEDRPLRVVALDLDHFKHVNDSVGHPAGDRLLRQVAARISAAAGPGDTVARTGGDEFVLVLAERDEGQAAASVDAVLRALAEPFEEEGQRIHLGCSAGIAGYPADGADAAALVKHAEVAMYRAKEDGRATLRFYRAGMNERAAERFALIDAMRHALAAGEFELHYQPQIALETGRLIGVEALIRWRHPQRGMMRPDIFIALAEETGLIVPIGAWVLRTACAQGAAWRRAGYGPLRMAVNLSPRQFGDAGLAGMVADILAATGMPATSLELEITEGLVMDKVEQAIATMHAVKSMGVRIAIDDFGTGYSSLAYLKRFPVNMLKIDQSFVRDIESDAGSAAMVGAVISMAHALGLEVIAEGIETPRQLEFLRGHGCDEGQGYLFGRPMPADALASLLDARRAPAAAGAETAGRNAHGNAL